jgi:hypothetical protein
VGKFKIHNIICNSYPQFVNVLGKQFMADFKSEQCHFRLPISQFLTFLSNFPSHCSLLLALFHVILLLLFTAVLTCDFTALNDSTILICFILLTFFASLSALTFPFTLQCSGTLRTVTCLFLLCSQASNILHFNISMSLSSLLTMSCLTALV